MRRLIISLVVVLLLTLATAAPALAGSVNPAGRADQTPGCVTADGDQLEMAVDKGAGVVSSADDC